MPDKLYVLKNDFLDWYLKDGFEKVFDNAVIDIIKYSLRKNGSYRITISDLLKSSESFHNTIPLRLVQGFSDEKPELKIEDLFSNFEIHLI